MWVSKEIVRLLLSLGNNNNKLGSVYTSELVADKIKQPKWVSERQYHVDDIVVYDKYIYVCVEDNTDIEFDENKWVNISGGKAHNRNIMYGFRLNETESDPSACITYLADAVGMTPAFMNYAGGFFDYGSWQNAFFMPRPCMLKYDGTVDYYLDVNDYGYKEDGVTPSDVSNENYEGNAMMEWGQNGNKIYYKFVPVRDKVTDIFIANYKADDNFVCPNFINENGEEVDHFYTAIYNGSNISSRLRSLSGKTHMVGQSGTTEIAYAQANGVRWYIEQYSDRQLIIILLMLMGKSLDSQKIYGSGHNSGGSGAGSNLATGLMDRKGLFWGSNGNTGVKVFGIENFWGEVYRRCAGFLSVDYKAKVKMYPPYNFSGDGYVEAGSLPTGNSSYITSMSFENNIMIPKAVSGSSTTYYCDIYYVASGTNYLLASGSSAYGTGCGFCLFHLHDPVSSGAWDVGASPSYR